jgi:Alcohol dehydrogenase GroES-like domain
MRATFIYGAGDVRVISVPDPIIQQPTDALVRVIRACICGSDLHPYHSMPAAPDGNSRGHECVGLVEDIGADVTSVSQGDLVIVPFAWSDGTCDYCREGLQTSCRHGGFWNANSVGGCQAEALRVPLADGTLVAAPVQETPRSSRPCSPSQTSTALAITPPSGPTSAPGPRSPSSATEPWALWPSCPPGSSAAEQIILMGRHTARTDLGREFGATHVIAERGGPWPCGRSAASAGPRPS